MPTTVKNGEAFKKFVAEMKKAKDCYVAIGLHEDAGEYKDGTSVVNVGLWNEFGTDNIPERAWMRTTIDENQGALEEFRKGLIEKVQAGNLTVRQALEKIGMRIQVLLQNKIGSNMEPENAPSTLKAKARAGQGSRTLIATGLMQRSVTYKVYGA